MSVIYRSSSISRDRRNGGFRSVNFIRPLLNFQAGSWARSWSIFIQNIWCREILSIFVIIQKIIVFYILSHKATLRYVTWP